jgi:hypothetical protein
MHGTWAWCLYTAAWALLVPALVSGSVLLLTAIGLALGVVLGAAVLALVIVGGVLMLLAFPAYAPLLPRWLIADTVGGMKGRWLAIFLAYWAYTYLAVFAVGSLVVWLRSGAQALQLAARLRLPVDAAIAASAAAPCVVAWLFISTRVEQRIAEGVRFEDGTRLMGSCCLACLGFVTRSDRKLRRRMDRAERFMKGMCVFVYACMCVCACA